MWAVAMQSHSSSSRLKMQRCAPARIFIATFCSIRNGDFQQCALGGEFYEEYLYWFCRFTLLYITHIVSMEQVFNFTLGPYLMAECVCNETSSDSSTETCLAVWLERFSRFRLNCGLKSILTSFVVFVVVAGDLHGNAAACAPPASVAFTAPAVLTHNALAVTIAQAWTPICRKQDGERDWSIFKLDSEL